MGASVLYTDEFGCKDGDRAVAYNVLIVAPGRYRLYQAVHKLGMRVDTTTYPAGSQATFTVAAGEVIYVGDIMYARYFPADLKEIRRNDEAAKQALAKLKFDSAPLRYRALIAVQPGS
jgi:hypothetical protein